MYHGACYCMLLYVRISVGYVMRMILYGCACCIGAWWVLLLCVRIESVTWYACDVLFCVCVVFGGVMLIYYIVCVVHYCMCLCRGC